MPFATKSHSYSRISLGVAASLLLAGPVWGGVQSGGQAAPGHHVFGQDVLPGAVPQAAKRVFMARQSALCLSAIGDAEWHYRVPHGLLAAISWVQTGRPMPVTREREP